VIMARWQDKTNLIYAVALLGFGRLLPLLALPLNGLRGYGDSTHFYNLAAIPGWPYLDYWSEFPPLFPFLSEGIYWLASGQEHVYLYLLLLILLAADCLNFWLFVRLGQKFWDGDQLFRRAGAYLVLLLTLPYTWWYFDALAVCVMLLAITLLLEKNNLAAGLALGAGLLLKLYPVLGLLAAWKTRPVKSIATMAGVAIIFAAVVYGSLWLASPEFTQASMASQASKGSWETVWALIDGNMGTGNFGPLWERTSPSNAYRSVGREAQVSPWLTLPLFLGAGLLGLLKGKPSPLRPLGQVGFGFALFFLWSPGWSPQWVLYILPLILLVLQERQALLLAASLVLVNLLEWPVLLSRGAFEGLWLTIPLRTMLFVVMAFLFWSQTSSFNKD